MMKKAELVFIPFPVRGHFVSTVELAKLLLDLNSNLSISVLIFKAPDDAKIAAFLDSLSLTANTTSATTTTTTTPRIKFIYLPQPEAADKDVTKFLSTLLQTQGPLVKEAVTNMVELSDSVPDSPRLAGFVLDMIFAPFVDMAQEFGVPSYVFYTSGATFLGFQFYIHALHDEQNVEIVELKDSDTEFTIPSYVNPVSTKFFPSWIFKPEGFAFSHNLTKGLRKVNGIIVNTFSELEFHAVDSLTDGKLPYTSVYPVGPILNLKGASGIHQNNDKIMKWLDEQPRSSVVFLCFGSMGSFGRDQMKEIACALEHSGHRFLWSVRQPPDPAKGVFANPTDYENVVEALPEGFLDRTAGIGMITGWAPQVARLGHPATGGFVSHCGWNSTLESIWFGVPIATWPLYAEQHAISNHVHHKGRSLLGIPELLGHPKDARQPIRIFLNYDAVGHSQDRDCRKVGDIVKLGEPPVSSPPGTPSCNPHGDPPIYGDCWYNCTLDDISGEDKRRRLRKALGQTADWFKRALSVEPVRGNLRLSGYSACGQDGGVQLPREYVEEGVADADLVLLVTTRPTTGNTLAWAVACERDQWGRAVAGHVNVAPRHLTAEAETLLSATLIHEVMHVLGFDPHAFAHFRDERKRRRSQVTEQIMDEKLGRMVTRVVLPRVVMHSRHHYGAFSENFTGLELEDGGGRGTSGSHWEKRLLMNEIMTGSVDTRSVVSKMTLALLEDSGWYQANYSVADRLDWGRNQGTDFVTSPCNLWKGAYHCNTTNLSGCTYNREAEGYCPIVSYSGDLPQWAQYFPQANKGGQSSLADYCTYFVAYSDGSCTDTNSARAPDRMLGEVRGSNSRCMASSLVRTGFVRGSVTQGNGCYQHRCVNNSLEVAVDGIWKVCPKSGGPVQFPGFNGELICPAYHELCSTGPVSMSGRCANSCNFNGDCVNGKCNCFLGFHGDDCSERSCPNNCNGHGKCLSNGVCECENGRTGIDCSTAICDEQCSLHGGVCDNGVCEFRCSDYAGYTCQNSSTLLSSLSVCKTVLERELSGQHCAPSEASILQQLEEVVVMPNYHRLFPGGARKLFNNVFGSSYCDAAAKRLACWISIQKCDNDGDNRLRVCHSACESYNIACGASLDCSDQTLFSSEEEGDGQCTGFGETQLSWFNHFRSNFFSSNTAFKGISVKYRQF